MVDILVVVDRKGPRPV